MRHAMGDESIQKQLRFLLHTRLIKRHGAKELQEKIPNLWIHGYELLPTDFAHIQVEPIGADRMLIQPYKLDAAGLDLLLQVPLARSGQSKLIVEFIWPQARWLMYRHFSDFENYRILGYAIKVKQELGVEAQRLPDLRDISYRGFSNLRLYLITRHAFNDPKPLHSRIVEQVPQNRSELLKVRRKALYAAWDIVSVVQVLVKALKRLIDIAWLYLVRSRRHVCEYCQPTRHEAIWRKKAHLVAKDIPRRLFLG